MYIGTFYVNDTDGSASNFSSFHDNTATRNGGGVCISNGTANFNYSAINDNQANDGGGVYATHPFSIWGGTVSVTFNQSTITQNNATNDGGGIYIYRPSWDDGTITITETKLENNTAKGYGGGIYCFSNEEIGLITSTVKDNNASDSGGGVYLASNANLSCNGSSITSNETGNFGGGVYIGANATLDVSGQVVVENNTSSRTSHMHNPSNHDDVCLEVCDNSTSTGQKGKINLTGAITSEDGNPHIGITECQVANDTYSDIEHYPKRQFTTKYETYMDASKDLAEPNQYFFSNDTRFIVEILDSEHTSTGIKEATLVKIIIPSAHWYVAGIVEDEYSLQFGDDTYDGKYPDTPKRTLTGPNGVFAGILAADQDPEEVEIFVVRAVSAEEEAKVRLTDGKVIVRWPEAGDTHFQEDNTIADQDGSKEIVLTRYAGGHQLSNGNTDNGGATTAGAVTGSSNNGPGQNTGPLFYVKSGFITGKNNTTVKAIKLYDIHMDGLRILDNKKDIAVYPYLTENVFNPEGNPIDPKSALLVVDGDTPVSLLESCELTENDNKGEGSNNSASGKIEQRPGGGVYCIGNSLLLKEASVFNNHSNTNGGGIYIDTGGAVTLDDSTVGGSDDDKNTADSKGGGVYKLGTLKVQGETLVTDNEAGTATDDKAVVENNVHIPLSSANDQTILITGELHCDSKIGVTKTKGEHTYDTDDNYTEVRTAIAANAATGSGHAFTAADRGIFFDDTDNYGVWSFDYSKDNDLDDSKAYSIDKCYFIETWRNYADNTFDGGDGEWENPYQINTARQLAYLAKQVNISGNYYPDKSFVQTADIDLAGHYWEPIGIYHYFKQSECLKDTPFAGNYDGRGHTIISMKSILPFQGMGLFGVTGTFETLTGAFTNANNTIQRTFVIDADLTMTHPEAGGMGGIVGISTSIVDRCEATGKLTVSKAPKTNATFRIGGIIGFIETVGSMLKSNRATGSVLKNSFSNVTITFEENDEVRCVVGGLAGSTETQMSYTSDIYNCYTKNKITGFSRINESSIGALVGSIGSGGCSIKNSYVVESTATKMVGYSNYNYQMQNCYAPKDGSTKSYADGTEIGAANDANANCYYSPTIGADQLGYMYADNILLDKDGTPAKYDLTATGAKVTGPLFEALNAYASLPSNSSLELDRWARPALAYYVKNGSNVEIEKPINGDLPVLLIDNYVKVDIGGVIPNLVDAPGVGNFRTVATHNGDAYTLQYGGPMRDDVYSASPSTARDELVEAIKRAETNDCIFIYGDIERKPECSIEYRKANAISIYEHSAIPNPDKLLSLDEEKTEEPAADGSTIISTTFAPSRSNIYVSITFDNSSGGLGMSTDGMNGLASQELPRDWHMFSTPLQNAPLGFNYYKSDGSTDTNVGNDVYQNNPWTNASGEFSWIDGKRYWMEGWTTGSMPTDGGYVSLNNLNKWKDGYFPSTFHDGLHSTTYLEDEATHKFGFGTISGTDENPSGTARYPYGMDMYAWYEPQYHYINFKRNGPNHWHSDEPHDHLDYWGIGANANERTLLTGKGYMATIAEKTLMQSHGLLNNATGIDEVGTSGTISIRVSKTNNNQHICEGWNLIGNPFHAYLDFNTFEETNWGLLYTESDVPNPNGGGTISTDDYSFYMVYDADGVTSSTSDKAYGAFKYYTPDASVEGAYASRYLHPHQGFYVKVTNNGLLKFDNKMTVSRATVIKYNSDFNVNTGTFRDERPAYPLVNLYLTSAKGCSDVTVVELHRPEWGGAPKMRDMYMGNGLFYAKHEGQNYAALFAGEDAERIPIHFEPKDKDGDTYTLSWNTANGDFSKLILVDNMTGVQYDMLRNSSYSFQGKKGDYLSRFYITFGVTGIDEETDDEDGASTGTASFAFYDGSSWVVTGEGQLTLIDLQGRTLWHGQADQGGQSRVSLPDVATGMYLLRLANESGTRVQKIVVQ